MNKAQQAMVDDGLPAAFIMTKAERHALWEATPPKNVQTFLDPRIEQDRALREQIKERLRNVHNQTTNSNHTQESNMPKYTIKPLDAHGHPVMRAITSINDDSDESQIEAKIVAAAERGGSKVANVLLINTLGQVVLAWSIVEGVAGPCDTGPFQPLTTAEPESVKEEAPADGEPVDAAAPQPAAEQESEVSKKAKKGKAKKAAPKRAKSDKPRGEKTLAISKLLSRASGCTAKEVLAATGWPSVSMPAMAKACGLKLRKDKKKGKPIRYFGT
jgi:hypothetical protein